MLFCLTIHPVVQRLESDFKVFYLDDGSLGGPVDEVARDVRMFEKEPSKLSFVLNHQKSEAIGLSAELTQPNSPFKDFKLTLPKDAVLLGSPIGDINSIDAAVREKVEALKFMGQLLSHFGKQDALLLLQHAFSIPKILHVLRTTPAFSHPSCRPLTVSCAAPWHLS